MALNKCKECGQEISSEAKACPQCGKPQRKKTRWGVILFVSLGIFSFFIFIAVMSGGHKSSVSVGKSGYLDAGAGVVPVAVDEAAFDAWTSASVAKDEHGRKVLLASMRVFAAPKGTKVLIIDQGTFKRKVRILDGKQKGMAGWVAMEFVKGI